MESLIKDIIFVLSEKNNTKTHLVMKKLTFMISYQPTNQLNKAELEVAGIWKATDGSYNQQITARDHSHAIQIAESKGTKVSANYIQSATDLAYLH